MASSGRKIVYVGEDKSYWKELCNRFTGSYSTTDFEYINLLTKEGESFQKLYVQLFDIVPDILYIDISKHTQDLVKLLKMVKREHAFSEIPVTVLVDKVELSRKAQAGGANFIHIKCGEYHDIVYDPYLVRYPKEAKKPAFAVARMQKDTQLVEDFRVGYITATSLHAEGDVRLEAGQLVEIESAVPAKVIPSKKFLVKEVIDHDLYYDHRYAYELEFQFVDRPEMDPDPLNAEEEKQKFEERMLEYQQLLKKAKKGNRDWVLDNIGNTTPKKTKILILDKSISALKDVLHPIANYPYLIRCQTLLSEELTEITAFRPSIFVFQYPSFELLPGDKMLGPEEQQVKVDELKELQDQHTHRFEYLINFIKKIEGYQPFILIYNSKNINSKGFQERFKYSLILANTDKLSIPNIVQLAEIYEKKQDAKYKSAIDAKIKDLKSKDAPKYRNLSHADFEEKRYYIKSQHDLSYVSIRHDIKIISLSESEVKFNTMADLELGTYRMEFPVEMSVSIIPQDGRKCTSQAGVNTYYGLINATGENDKKILRQRINDVFTKSVTEAEEKELEAFQELNKKAQQDVVNKEAGAQQKEAEQRIKEKIDNIKGVERSSSGEVSKSAESESSGGESDSFGFKK